MTEQFAVVFYPRTKQSDVVSCDDIIGELGVGATTKVLSKGRTYPAKDFNEVLNFFDFVFTKPFIEENILMQSILCIGEKEHCERKLQCVTTDGVLENSSFRTAEGSLGSELSRLLNGSNDTGALWELRDTSNELLRRVPRRGLAEDPLLYGFAPQSFLEGLRKLNAGNINKFALDLEKKVYEDDTSELALPVEKRVKNANRVEFIKECIYKYYLSSGGQAKCMESGSSGAEFTREEAAISNDGVGNNAVQKADEFEADAPAAFTGASASNSASVFDFEEE